MTHRALIVALSLLSGLSGLSGLAACRDATGKQSPVEGSAAPVGSGKVTIGPNGQRIETVPVTRVDPRDDLKPDRDPDAPDWTPAEFKAGAARWKDSAVFVDGKPISFLTF